MAEENTLKTYYTNLSNLNKDLDQLKRESSTVNSKIVKKKREIASIENKINKMHTGKVIISEHAIIRYLERIEGINMEAVKDKMVNSRTRDAINVLTSGTFPIQGGRLEVKNNIVITVIKD